MTRITLIYSQVFWRCIPLMLGVRSALTARWYWLRWPMHTVMTRQPERHKQEPCKARRTACSATGMMTGNAIVPELTQPSGTDSVVSSQAWRDGLSYSSVIIAPGTCLPLLVQGKGGSLLHSPVVCLVEGAKSRIRDVCLVIINCPSLCIAGAPCLLRYSLM